MAARGSGLRTDPLVLQGNGTGQCDGVERDWSTAANGPPVLAGVTKWGR